MGRLNVDYLKIVSEELEVSLEDYKSFVETGSHVGETCVKVSSLFDEMHTIEISEKYYNITRQNFLACNIKNAKQYLGDSIKVLSSILENIEKKTVFWLDGHWSMGDTGRGEKDCPLIEECLIVSNFCRTKNTSCLVLIDDVRLFGKDFWKDATVERIDEIFSGLIVKSFIKDDIYCLLLKNRNV